MRPVTVVEHMRRARFSYDDLLRLFSSVSHETGRAGQEVENCVMVGPCAGGNQGIMRSSRRRVK